MKSKDVANQYGLNADLFDKFLKKSDHKIKTDMFDRLIIDDSEDVNAIVADFKRYEAEREVKKVSKENAAAEKEAALPNILITSGFSFDGYTITKYSGYISGDDAVSVNRGLAVFGVGVDVKDQLLGSLVQIRRNALTELKEAAYALGCNAVIGVDFDYLTLDPQTANLAGGTTYQPYIFCVTANGNAVVIEKNV